MLQSATGTELPSHGTIYYNAKELPMKRRRKFFEQIFTQMNFSSSDGHFPYYLSETEISEYTTAYSFSTLIPVQKWINERETLEMYLDANILDIKQAKESNLSLHLPRST